MYSEKLKKLVQDKIPLKFRIKDEQQSKELQEFLFTLGFGWVSAFYERNEKKIIEDKHKIVWCTDKPFLYFRQYISSGDIFFIRWDDDPENFENDKILEFDLENDCLITIPRPKEPTEQKLGTLTPLKISRFLLNPDSSNFELSVIENIKTKLSELSSLLEMLESKIKESLT